MVGQCLFQEKFGSNKMKRFIIISLFLIVVNNTYATSARNVLVKSFEYSKASSLKVQMSNPFQPLPKGLQILPYAEKLIFYRNFTSKGLNLRVETFQVNRKKDKKLETYIKNLDGVFGVAPDGFAAEVFEVQDLWIVELMFQSFSNEELSFAKFDQLGYTKYKGKDCYRVIISFPRTEDFLCQITGESKMEVLAKKSMYMRERPFKYDFLIDQKSNIIVSRKHYNAYGKLIFSIAFEQWQNLRDVKGLFDTPSDIKGKFVEQKFFSSRLLDKMIKAKKQKYKKRSNFPFYVQVFEEWILRNGSILFATIAGVLIIVVVVIKCKEYKKS